MRGTGQELAGLMLSAGCAGCGAGRGAGALCAGCAGELTAGPVRRVAPRPRPAGLPRVYAAAAYAGAPRAVLLAHKERGALRLARPLGAALARAVRAACAIRGSAPAGGRAPATAPGGPEPAGFAAVDRVLLVPVPSARRAVALRGHDPVRRLALVAAERLRRCGIRAELLPCLRQRRPVADQAGLSAGERWRNVHGALEVVRGGALRLRSPGCRVVLVDDVLTTGASLAEAARAVRAASGRGGIAAVVAAPRDAFEAGRTCPPP